MQMNLIGQPDAPSGVPQESKRGQRQKGLAQSTTGSGSVISDDTDVSDVRAYSTRRVTDLGPACCGECKKVQSETRRPDPIQTCMNPRARRVS